jgi:hypothetical protein
MGFAPLQESVCPRIICHAFSVVKGATIRGLALHTVCSVHFTGSVFGECVDPVGPDQPENRGV